MKFKEGDVINFIGNTHYGNAMATSGTSCKKVKHVSQSQAKDQIILIMLYILMELLMYTDGLMNPQLLQ